ncbi:MAG: exodeoxyribonuclease VII large subunit, partial [Bacteroidota bacterium]
GLKLIIEDLDPSHSLGQLELQRRQSLEELQQLQLLDKNASLPLSPVVQRIALITSERAAGLQDYLQQLNENPYAYHFNNQLFPAAVQGDQAAKDIIRQIRKIQLSAQHFDAIVVIRGGGAKLDLLAFDDLDLAKTVANCSLPVITGIGHEIDESILDRVAHTALKTPTAVAEFLLQTHLYFESAITQLGQNIQHQTRRLLQYQTTQLQQYEQLIQIKSKSDLQNAKRMLDYISAELPKTVQFNLNSHQKHLGQLEQICRLLSPEETLRRGFSLTLQDGKILRLNEKLEEGSVIQTLFQEGSIESEITKINRT